MTAHEAFLEEDVLKDVRKKLKSGEMTSTTLQTDSRVLARITDGIYRSPAAAIRELVANAYDADASLVTVETNSPWFDRIVVRDDGEGMDETALVRLIKHIGGSSKRTFEGRTVGTTGDNPNYSPHGRRLIGRIGIGLFSVAQMTRHFQIVTKRAGSDIRLFADVVLDTYNEDKLAERSASSDRVSTGRVTIQSYRADDIESHGTDVVLLELKPEARALLTSQEDRDADKTFTYHIGVAEPQTTSGYSEEPKLPWVPADAPIERFRKLAAQVSAWSGTEKAKIENILDRYLQVMWKLALSVPLGYIDGVHPFDLDDSAEPRLFRLSNEAQGAAVEITLRPGETIRERLQLHAPEMGRLPFRLMMDGVELRRPLRFTGLYSPEKPQDRPLLFVGSWAPELSRIPATTSGGRELAFEGYMLWMPRVIPAEHAGLLVRIADASGILFDERFMEYPIAELTRLRQTSAEVFVSRGLDAALNIDRESFNSGHPHAKLVRYWVHQALRQLATTQKRIAAEARERRQSAAKEIELGAVERLVSEKLAEAGVTDHAAVEIVEQRLLLEVERRRGTLAYDQTKIMDKVKPARGSNVRRERELQKQKLRAIARLLDGFGAFENMDFAQQQEVLNGIARIVWGSANG